MTVFRQDIAWDWQPRDESAARLLPKMQTDVSLRAPGRRVIIECKYTPSSTQSNFDTEKLRSGHLYQVYAYLSNLPLPTPGEHCEMVLVYPKVDEDLDVAYDYGGWVIRVRTVDLSQPWRSIQDDLLHLIGADDAAYSNFA